MTKTSALREKWLTEVYREWIVGFGKPGKSYPAEPSASFKAQFEKKFLRLPEPLFPPIPGRELRKWKPTLHEK